MLQLEHDVSMKTAVVHSRIQPEIKEKAEGILKELGVSPTEAIRMFYTQITLRKGLPFEVSLPNEETIQAFKDSREGKDLTCHKNVEELFLSWGE